jgi:hypothetical protein
MSALELAVDLIRIGQGAEGDGDATEIESLIAVGLMRLKRMGR